MVTPRDDPRPPLRHTVPVMVATLWTDLVNALWPPTCLACGAPAPADDFCARCAETAEGPPAGALACWAFGGAVAEAIRACKFRPDAGLADALARAWVARLSSGAAPPLPPLDGVTFVPAHWRRRLARGFDLPAVLAQALARHARAPVVDALVARRRDPPLSLGADRALRATSVHGRFLVRGPVASRHLLLVDDVRTTGATLGEAARVLREAGATVTEASLAVVP